MFLVTYIADIQEFYELTLLDETKTVQQKTAETLQMASKWETGSGVISAHLPPSQHQQHVIQQQPALACVVTSGFYPTEEVTILFSIYHMLQN